jgi:hypothetical protein
MLGLFLEDIDEGLSVDLGSYHFTRESILKFARKYDPQPFHVDEEAALRGPFGKLSASGWHTASGWMKCFRQRMMQRGRNCMRPARFRPRPTRPARKPNGKPVFRRHGELSLQGNWKAGLASRPSGSYFRKRGLQPGN